MYRGHQWIKKNVSTVYFPLSPRTRNIIGFEKYCRRLCPTHHLCSLLPITCRALMIDQPAQTRRHLRLDSTSLPTAASMPGRPHCAGQPPPMLACAPSPATTRASAPPPRRPLPRTGCLNCRQCFFQYYFEFHYIWMKFEIQFDCNVRFKLKFVYVRLKLTKLDLIWLCCIKFEWNLIMLHWVWMKFDYVTLSLSEIWLCYSKCGWNVTMLE
jgi:hypothetical protein